MGLTGPNSRCQQGCDPFWSLWGRSRLLAMNILEAARIPWLVVLSYLQSQQRHNSDLGFSHHLSLLWLWLWLFQPPLSFMRTLVIVFSPHRQSRIVFPSQDPQLIDLKLTHIFFFAIPHAMWNSSSLTRDRTSTPSIPSITGQPQKST